MITKITLKNILSSLTSDEPTCLVCFTHSEELECINKNFEFDSAGFVNGKFSIAEMLCAVTHNLMSPTTDFSQYICAQCLDSLTISFMFLKQCQATSEAIVQAILPLYSSVEKINNAKAVTVMKIPNVSSTATPDYVDYYESYSKVGKLFKFENKITNTDSDSNDWGNFEETVFACERESPTVHTEKRRDKKVSKIKGLKKYECTVCGKHFSGKYEFMGHISTHPPGSKHKCKECGKIFANSAYLRKHYAYLHVPEDHKDIFLCPICGKRYKKKAQLSAHQVTHRDKKFKCNNCDKLFQTKSRLASHFYSIHSKNRVKYMCDICGKVFKSKYVLQGHLQIHEPATCVSCNVSFKNKAIYHRHSCPGHTRKGTAKPVRVRRQNPKVICDYCGYAARDKTNLTIHIRDTHLKLLVFTCNVCNKIFHRKSGYNRHINMHKQLKPEQCDVCGNKFVDKRALLYHSRLHTGEKPFECEICGERFLSKCRRLTHVRRKHTDPTFGCPYCKSMFHSNSDRNTHIKRVHLKIKRKLKSKIDGSNVNEEVREVSLKFGF